MSVIKIYSDAPDEQLLDQLSQKLRQGSLMILPSGTGYCYACDALNQKAVDRLVKLKGYGKSKRPLALMCEDISMAAQFCRINNEAFRFIKDREGGRYTFILPALGQLPKTIKDRKEIGLRLAIHPVSKHLIHLLEDPLMVASINMSEDLNVEDLSNPELIAEYEETKHHDMRADVLIDSGEIARIPSEVIDCTSDEYLIIREGGDR